MLTSAQIDRSILFGSLAIGTGIVSSEAILNSLKFWSYESPHDLSGQLIKEGLITESDRDYINLLVDVEWDNFGGDMSQAIRSFELSDDIRAAFTRLRNVESSRSVTSLGGLSPTTTPQYWSGGQNLHTKSGYIIHGQYKSGGLGMVYVATDTTLNREVAVKEIHPEHQVNEILRTRFREEAEVAAFLDHPGIVPVHGIGTAAEGRPFFVMKLIRGVSLKEAADLFHRNRLQDPRPTRDTMELRRLIQRFVSVCDAIGYAHSKHVMHRDIKPGNIMLGEFGETIVVDWGLAKKFKIESSDVEVDPAQPEWADPNNVSVTKVGAKEGTPGYMAPEVAMGQRELLSPRTDIFCLGATLYYILTGQAPFEGKGGLPALEAAIKTQCPKPRSINPSVSKSLQAVCLKAMATVPTDRYVTCRDFAEDVERWLADEPVLVYREDWPTRLSRSIRKHRAAYTIAGVSLVSISVMMTIMFGIIGQARIKEVKANEVADLARIVSVLNAELKSVPDLMASFKDSRLNIESRLLSLLNDSKLEKDQRLRAFAALQESNPELADRFCDELLDANYQQLGEVRKMLSPFRGTLKERLWQIAQKSPSKSKRLNACLLLCELDPTDARWKTVGAEAAHAIITPEVSSSVQMSYLFLPVRSSMFETIRKNYSDGSPEAKKFAATAVNVLANDLPDVLCDFLLESDSEQYRILYDEVFSHFAVLTPRLLNVLKQTSNEIDYAAQQKELDQLARQKTNAMRLLLSGGVDESVWPMLRSSNDNRVRTLFTDEVKSSGIDPARFVQRLLVEPEPSIRRSILFCLAEYEFQEIAATQRTDLVAKLRALFESDPDRGIHSISGYLLRHWGQGTELPQIAASNPNEKFTLDRDWFVTPKGYTMALFRPDMRVQIGARAEEENYRHKTEARHYRMIRRAYGLSTMEVTVGQYRQFEPNAKLDLPKQSGDPLSNPVAAVSWHRAAKFCNWLSLEEGISPDQLCYVEIPNSQGLMKTKDNFLSLHGYRLPTEAEWFQAMRAGTNTNYFFGHLPNFLTKFGWTSGNAKGSTWPVGTLLPNDYGLFDVIGNVGEWTEDRQTFGDADFNREYEDDEAHVIRGMFLDYRMWAGSAFLNGQPASRSGFRNGTGAGTRYDFIGFRIAKTVAIKQE